MDNTLTPQDFERLFEAIECWEQDLGRQALVSTIMSVSMARGQEERDEALAKQKKEELARAGEVRLRREQATVMKFKLIQLRDSGIAAGAVAVSAPA